MTTEDTKSATNLVSRMTNAERDQSFADSVPKDAATIILIDRSGSEPKVLLGKRHAGHKFMPGKFVFPGGRIEDSDAAMTAASELHPQAADKLSQRIESGARAPRAFALATIRELCEETGLLLGRVQDRAPSVPNEEWQAFADAKVIPDLSQLYFVARAVTPPKRPKRFDTRFFTADAEAIAHKIEGVVSPDSELVELVWIPIAQARTLDMPTITGVVLDELATRVKAGMGHDLPVPYYYMENQQFQRELL
jgi:8-oxo-dGTP pyrophosphatase MutT (NUDIX family)